jgi:hypothetical protein
MHPREATIELIRSAFRFEVEDRSMLERQLELFTRVASSIPIRTRISIPWTGFILPRVWVPRRQ